MCSHGGRNDKLAFEQKENRISFFFGIFFILYICLAVGVAYLLENWMPTALTIEDESNNPDRFIGERAQAYLKGLTDLGPRVAGSYQNEVLAVNYLESIIVDIIQNSNNVQNIEYDIGIVTGSYYLAYKPYGSINAYANLQNIVVKVNAVSDSANSVLINSHFDTVNRSPGGSDDGINCAVMLEVLRKMSKSTERPANHLIFLFNGGEESNIQASHGFITQHKWAENIKVVINLEATGADGKEILFQAGPDQAWLMKYYSKVPYPFSHVSGEEIFKSNIIPSDSDFRIFRDFGGVIGYDFAYFKDGYRYHTKYDGFNNIKLERYQRTGDNILRLVQELANAPEVSGSLENEGGAIYFDVTGLFMVYYNEDVEIIVNVLVILLSIGLFAWSLYELRIGCKLVGWSYIGLRILNLILGWITSFAVMALFALFLGGINRTMSWYKTPILAIGLYSPIALIFTHLITMLFDKCLKKFKLSIHLTKDVLIQIHVVRIFWTTVMIIGAALGIKSVYLFMIPALFNTFFMFIIHLFKLYYNTHIWLLVYLIGTFIPTALGGAITYHILTLFIPICGRFGTSLNPEFMIGAFIVLLTIFITCYYMPLFSLLSKQVYILMFLASVFLGTFIVVLTPIGFPYSGDENYLAPQRFPVYHSQRTYHDENNNVIQSDSGFYFRNMDYNSPRSVKDYLNGMENITSLKENCEKALFCGLPVGYSRDFEELESNSWIPSKAPIFSNALPTLTVDNIELISETIRRYYFTVTGTDCMDLYLSPKEGITFLNISLNNFVPTEQPLWNGRPTIYILYVNGKEITPLNFYVDFAVPKDWNLPVVDIAVVGKYIHEDEHVYTEEFQNFLNSFPEWTVLTTIALAHYESWIY